MIYIKRLILSWLLCVWFFPAIPQNKRNSTEFQIPNNYIDSASSLYDSAANIAERKVQKIDSALSSLSNSPAVITDSLNAIQSIFSDSLKRIQQSANGFLEKTGLDQQVPSLPKLENAEVNALSLPDIGLPGNPIKALDKDLSVKFNIDESLLDELPELDGRKINPDQLLDKKASNIDGLSGIKNRTKKAGRPFKELAGKPDELKKYRNANQYKSMANQEAMKKMKELFQQHVDKLEAAQSQMKKLKRKYSYVPNSNDLSTAVKINSMKGEPLKKRLIIGTNLILERGNPLSLGFAPLLMYKINRAFHAGVSGSYKASIDYDEKNLSTNPQDVLGASVLVRHFLTRGFFAYSEFEYKSAAFRYDGKQWNSISGREWTPGWLAGIGKEMSLMGKLKGTIILTYDFLHSTDSFSRSPWNVKIGFHLDGLEGRRKQKISEDTWLQNGKTENLP